LAALSERFWVHFEFVSQEASLKVIVILITILCFATSLQGKGRNPVTASVTLPADQNTKSPPPPMERLIHALSGEWSTEELYDPSDLLPAGGKGHSRDSYRVGPARMSLVEEYHGDGVAGKSWGTGIIWWEAEDHGFHFVWCDSYALDRGCRVSSQVGKWDGDDFVQNDVRKVSGKQVVEREVWSGITPNSFIQTLYMGETPAKLKRFMTATATRRGKRGE
jgi:hypothetical protein